MFTNYRPLQICDSDDAGCNATAAAVVSDITIRGIALLLPAIKMRSAVLQERRQPGRWKLSRAAPRRTAAIKTPASPVTWSPQATTTTTTPHLTARASCTNLLRLKAKAPPPLTTRRCRSGTAMGATAQPRACSHPRHQARRHKPHLHLAACSALEMCLKSCRLDGQRSSRYSNYWATAALLDAPRVSGHAKPTLY